MRETFNMQAKTLPFLSYSIFFSIIKIPKGDTVVNTYVKHVKLFEFKLQTLMTLEATSSVKAIKEAVT